MLTPAVILISVVCLTVPSSIAAKLPYFPTREAPSDFGVRKYPPFAPFLYSPLEEFSPLFDWIPNRNLRRETVPRSKKNTMVFNKLIKAFRGSPKNDDFAGLIERGEGSDDHIDPAAIEELTLTPTKSHPIMPSALTATADYLPVASRQASASKLSGKECNGKNCDSVKSSIVKLNNIWRCYFNSVSCFT